MSHILIVDDNDDIRLAMSDILSIHGFDVSVAENGIKALSILESADVDVVLLDIFMPDKDGLETIGEIRRKYQDIKIIAMSGHGGEGFNPLEFARSLGAQETLSKPFSADEMIATLRKFII